MGGKIFTSEPDSLHVPRMNRSTYEAMRNYCIDILSAYYTTVICVYPAPQKDDHGDVDLIVSSPRPDSFPSTEALKAALAAERVKIHQHSEQGRSFAIPYSVLGAVDGTDELSCFAQIDVTAVEPDCVDWYMLQQSYGDLWQIVGKFLRPHGLTATNTGLHLRICGLEEDQKTGHKEGRVFLSRNPQLVGQFLGLDMAKWHKGFDTLEELFEWCCQGRLFSKAAFEEGKEMAKDRQRLKKRPAYKRFTEEWLPANLSTMFPSSRKVWGREEVKDAALEFFSRRTQYENLMDGFNRRETEEALWDSFNPLIPRAEQRTRYVKRALRRWVEFVDGIPRVRDTPEDLEEQQPVWTGASRVGRDALHDFVRENWDMLKEREKARDEQKKTDRGLKKDKTES